MRNIFDILIIAVFSFFVLACEDEKYASSSDVKLNFSENLVRFDTVFTTMGSAVQSLKIYNPYDQPVLVSSIRLASGDRSNFKLNVNGSPGNEVFGVEIPSKDSIYIFVEVTIDPSGKNLPFIVRDSIELVTNENLQYISVIAWGQDVVLVKGNISQATSWTADKPYLVDASVRIDSNAILRINPGARIYFRNGTGLYVKGKIVVSGSVSQPVIFQGARQEGIYQHMPDQWNGILLYSGSHDNVFNFSEIKNAGIGLQVGTINDDGYASVVLANTKIYNHSYSGIFALHSKIKAYNCVISNCGSYAAALLVGGEYEFYHSTIANYWHSFAPFLRTTASLMISNHIIIEKKNGKNEKLTGNLDRAYFGNCIITGNIASGNELELAKARDVKFNYRFDHCMIQLADTFNITDATYYNSIVEGADPAFTSGSHGGMAFELDTLSPAKDAGAIGIGRLFPLDILNQSRVADGYPDLGAYERIEKKIVNKMPD